MGTKFYSATLQRELAVSAQARLLTFTQPLRLLTFTQLRSASLR